LKQHLVRYALGVLLVLVLVGHAARFYQIGFINQLDAIIYDAKLRLTMPRTPEDRVVILDIDEKSLAEIGRWPWDRKRMATLIGKLFDRYGISLLGVDIVFAEPDESSGLKTLEALAATEFRNDNAFQATLERLRAQLDFDNLFAESLKGRPVILGYYLSNRSEGTSTGMLPAPVFPSGTFRGRNIPFTSWTSFGANLARFQEAALGAGHFNPLVDFDGISRRVPMIAEYQGEYYEALSLAMVRALLGNPKIVPGYPEPSAFSRGYTAMEWIELPTAKGTLRVPVDENVAALIPFRGNQGSFPYISLADVLAERTKPEQLRGKIALMGTTAPGLLDLRATPVSGAYPGVEIHANLITGMLDGKIKHRPQYVVGADVVATGLAGLMLVFLIPLLSPLRATLLTALVLLSLLSINLAFWQLGDLVLPLAGALLLTFLLFALNMSYGYFVESRAKRQFTELFGQYVPPELVEEMSKDPESYSMEGRSAELTVLFSDVRGFTSISEGLSPKQLAQLMNEYLGAMTEVIRDQRGTLDKYIGDAIMAFWGAPVDDADHARHGVISAMAMQQALGKVNETFVAKGWPKLKIGVGVNTGQMTVGDMGSPVRKAYTVLGDAVNLASRLEGLTKKYGVGVLVGEATRKGIRDIAFREVDRVRVKGKDEPVAIYEPLGIDSQLGKAQHDELKLWHQALRYYRAQDWDQAELALMNLARMAPSNALYPFYVDRVNQMRRAPPGAGWDGVTAFDEK
jgi:adenylate cyclase